VAGRRTLDLIPVRPVARDLLPSLLNHKFYVADNRLKVIPRTFLEFYHGNMTFPDFNRLGIQGTWHDRGGLGDNLHFS
jgi:hypothetical protein